MKYEWDAIKNRSNIIKHGIDFDYAICVFDDEKRIEFVDGRKDYGEVRYKTVGIIDGRYFAVIYTLRTDSYRVISARGARKDEKQDYLCNTQTWRET